MRKLCNLTMTLDCWYIFMSKHKLPIRRALTTIIALSLFIFCSHPSKFAPSSYPCIKKAEIYEQLVPYPDALKIAAQTNKPLCNLPELSNQMLYPNSSVTQQYLDNLYDSLSIKEGGYWQPKHCIAQHQVSIIIPYRDRESQLHTFLAFMHPFLQQQLLEYRIIVVEQVPKVSFNRAKLFNVGFLEALKISPCHCFIFHDVDLLPQKLSNIYACTQYPRHMSSSLNTFRYILLYTSLFGGAVAITKDQFELVNGFSNIFYGWGGEDDDFQNRISSRGLKILRFEPSVARYIMLSHRKEKPSENRFTNLKSGSDRFEIDGINNIKYVIIDSKYEKLYTWFLVDL